MRQLLILSIPINNVILDGARLGTKLFEVLKFDCKPFSLYKGRSEEALAEVAPYLVALKEKPEFDKWLFENGWGNSWGIFISSNASFEELHKHFRKFLLVKTEDAQELYFRYYDPRVLRSFLLTCTSDQLTEFFGPVQKYIMEDEDPNYALIFSLEYGLLKRNRINLTQGIEYSLLPAEKERKNTVIDSDTIV